MGNNLSSAKNALPRRNLLRLQDDSKQIGGYTQPVGRIIEPANSRIPCAIQIGDFENKREADGMSTRLLELNQPEEHAYHSQTSKLPESAIFNIYSSLPIEGLNGDYIRVLTILPGVSGSRMLCELETVYLDQNPRHEALSYEALSYAWGSPTLSRLIWVNGKVMAISSNLESALEHLRLTQRPRKLWIDALCIDQGNMHERSCQVLLMKRIYLRAKRVLIWLGPQDVESDLAFDIVKALCSDVDIRTLGPANKYEETDLATPLLTHFGEESMIALRATFSDREWWKRIWVIQEVVSARDARIVCGQRSISWGLLDEILHAEKYPSIKKRCKTEAQKQLASTMHSAILFTAIRSQIREHQMKDEGDPLNKVTFKISLCSLLALFEGNFCTDPRDRIYALQNIIDEKSLTIIPDYRKSMIEVFCEGTKAMVAEAGLNVLAYGYRSSDLPSQSDSKRRPSWVVDWSIPRDFSTLEVSSMRETLYHAGDGMIEIVSTEGENPKTDPFCLLRINWVFDEEVAEVLGIIGVFDDEVAEVLYRVEMEADNYKEWFRNWAPSKRALTEFELDRYWRTLMLDVRRPMGWPVRITVDDIRYFRSMFVFWTQHPGWKALANCPYTFKSPPPSLGSFSDYLGDHLRGWAFCTTKKGRMGWIPNPSQAGDIICIAPRSTLPLVIRKARVDQDKDAISRDEKDSFEFVGTAYISDIMDGNQNYDHTRIINLV